MTVLEAGKPLEGLALGVLGANRILYGEGAYLRASTKDFDPSFDEAWAALETSRGNLKMGLSAKDSAVKDRYIRMAPLAYLAKEELGWKGIEDGLPSRQGRRPYRTVAGPSHFRTEAECRDLISTGSRG
jgi:hypothetical protein